LSPPAPASSDGGGGSDGCAGCPTCPCATPRPLTPNFQSDRCSRFSRSWKRVSKFACFSGVDADRLYTATTPLPPAPSMPFPLFSQTMPHPALPVIGSTKILRR
jgi:hypothetical protein